MKIFNVAAFPYSVLFMRKCLWGCMRRLRSGAKGVQALLALAGEACTPAISKRLDSFCVGPQIGAMGTRRR